MAIRRSVMPAALLTTVLLAGTPGYADPASTSPVMDITITYHTWYHRVCTSGHVQGASNTLPTWEFVVAGARGDGTPIEIDATFTGNSFGPKCYDIWQNNTLVGNYTAVLTYAGAGDDMPMVAAADGVWHLGTDNRVEVDHA